jgi:hypothetical protein
VSLKIATPLKVYTALAVLYTLCIGIIAGGAWFVWWVL